MGKRKAPWDFSEGACDGIFNLLRDGTLMVQAMN